MVGVSLDSDWCQKAFLFFCPITKQHDQAPSRFASSYKIDTSRPVARHIFTRRKKVLITAQNVKEIVRHIRKKLVDNKLDLSQIS